MTVGGEVVHGTIVRDAGGVAFHMEDLTGRPTTVAVRYAGQMPATFGAGVQVVVSRPVRRREPPDHRRPARDQVPLEVRGQGEPAAPAEPRRLGSALVTCRFSLVTQVLTP